MKKAVQTTPERPDLGVVTIDPRVNDIRTLIPFCVAGSPTRCLIATVATEELGGLRVSVHVNHTPDGKVSGGKIGLTYGDYRFERPMNASELRFAQAFDYGRTPRRVLSVSFNLEDPIWDVRPKAKGGGRSGGKRGTGTGYEPKRYTRAKSLAMWRAQRGALQDGTAA